MLTIGGKQDWWIGCPTEDLNHDTVMDFRASGHELEMIYRAMETAHIGEGNRVVLHEPVPEKKGKVSKGKKVSKL